MKTLPGSARLKLDLMFDGIRYSEALGRAAEQAFPNFYPYRFKPGEDNPTGKPKVDIPYLMFLQDGTLVRVKGNSSSSWQVVDSDESGYQLIDDGNSENSYPVQFAPLPDWMKQETTDGSPMAQAGVSLHGDMAVINIAPGCDYFLQKSESGSSMRCSFCAYGAPNARVSQYGQSPGKPGLPAITYERMQETLRLALEQSEIRHIYLVAGSLTDWHEEGKRFMEIARVVQQVNQHKVPVTCGSGALPLEIMQQMFDEGLVISSKVVGSVEEAVDHINKYGSMHSESIITENYTHAQYFLDRVDSAAVYVNASTRFTDGFEFGYGAEIGISTQKLHARGPMGLKELTTNNREGIV